MKKLLKAQVTNKVLDTPKISQTIGDLEVGVRLLVSSNDELNQELEKTNNSTTRLHQIMWQHHLESAPTFTLYGQYELQCDIYLSVFTFHRGQELSDD